MIRRNLCLTAAAVSCCIIACYAAFVYGQSPTGSLICVHGNSGQVQTKNASAIIVGSGLEYQSSESQSWLHYSIPLKSDTKVTGIGVVFSVSSKTETTASWTLDFYDSYIKAKSYQDDILGSSNQKNVFHGNAIDPDHPVIIKYGAGISLLPKQSTDENPVKYTIHSVCVNTID